MPSDSKTEKTLQQLRLLVQLGQLPEDQPIDIRLLEEIYDIPSHAQRDWRRGRHHRRELNRPLRSTKLGDLVLVTPKDWRRFADHNAEDTESGEGHQGPGVPDPQVD